MTQEASKRLLEDIENLEDLPGVAPMMQLASGARVRK
jgi:hypothetical protein